MLRRVWWIYWGREFTNCFITLDRKILSNIGLINVTMLYIPEHIITELSELSCEAVAGKLGLEVCRHKMKCFMHDDHNPSLSFYGLNKEKWYCFVCKKGGNAISLVMDYLNVDFLHACEWLCTSFGFNCLEDKSAFPHLKNLNIKKYVPNKPVKPFSINIAEWLLKNTSLSDKGKEFLCVERHIDSSVIESLRITSIDDPFPIVEAASNEFSRDILLDSGFFTLSRGKLFFKLFTPCLLLPYFDIDGKMIGMQSRYLGINHNAPRFQFLSGQKTRLYNMPILKTMAAGDDLFICEGITDCLALLSSGKKAVAVPSATLLPRLDLCRLRLYKLHMYPDNDKAGKNAFDVLRRYFVNHGILLQREHLPEDYKDYCEYYIDCIYGK